MSTSRESSDIPALHVAAAVLAGVVFLFFAMRTVVSLGGRTQAGAGDSAVSSAARAVRARSEGITSVDPPPTDSLSPTTGRRLAVDSEDRPGAVIIAARLDPDLGAGRGADFRPPISLLRRSQRPQVGGGGAPPSPPTPVPADPPPEEVAEPTPTPPPPPQGVTLRGRLARPGPNGLVALRNYPVYLYDLVEVRLMEGRTDFGGAYTFEDLRPGALYYVIATFEADLRYGQGVDLTGIGSAGPGWGNNTVATATRLQLSWHQAVEAPTTPGSYVLDLEPTSADPEYCTDLRPTNDPVTRTPYRSWRRAFPQPF